MCAAHAPVARQHIESVGAEGVRLRRQARASLGPWADLQDRPPPPPPPHPLPVRNHFHDPLLAVAWLLLRCATDIVSALLSVPTAETSHAHTAPVGRYRASSRKGGQLHGQHHRAAGTTTAAVGGTTATCALGRLFRSHAKFVPFASSMKAYRHTCRCTHDTRSEEFGGQSIEIMPGSTNYIGPTV